jgi:hypothetical protein
MLYISANLLKYDEFKSLFQEMNKDKEFIDLSRVSSNNLITETDSIVTHHTNCCVFLGYLEPGWMLEPSHQTRMRKLFRKFPVAAISNFVESLPFSWKNEIDTFYIDEVLHKNGASHSINNGGSL